MVDFGESDKMIKISGKMDKSNTSLPLYLFTFSARLSISSFAKI